MSKYTTQVRFICETAAGKTESQDYTQVESIVTTAAPLIFESYPIFDETYRLGLNKKILRHYYTREICAESVGLWKLWLNNKMKEIMPYYNKMYESELIKYGVLDTMDVRTVRSREENGKETSSVSGNSSRVSNSSTDHLNKFSDTPQGALDGVVAGDYLTTATADSGTASGVSRGVDSSSGSRSNEVSEGYFERIVGRTGVKSGAQLVKELRETFLNIDEMIIEELKDLFFGLWE